MSTRRCLAGPGDFSALCTLTSDELILKCVTSMRVLDMYVASYDIPSPDGSLFFSCISAVQMVGRQWGPDMKKPLTFGNSSKSYDHVLQSLKKTNPLGSRQGAVSQRGRGQAHSSAALRRAPTGGRIGHNGSASAGDGAGASHGVARPMSAGRAARAITSTSVGAA